MSSLTVTINNDYTLGAPSRRASRNTPASTITSNDEALPLSPVASSSFATEEQYTLSGYGSGENGVWSADGLRLAHARPRKPTRRHSLEGGCQGCHTSESTATGATTTKRGPHGRDFNTFTPRVDRNMNAVAKNNASAAVTASGASSTADSDNAKRISALMVEAGMTQGPLRPHEERFWNWFLQYPMMQDTVVLSN